MLPYVAYMDPMGIRLNIHEDRTEFHILVFSSICFSKDKAWKGKTLAAMTEPLSAVTKGHVEVRAW